MAVARCARNIRYRTTAWHMISQFKETYGGNRKRRVICSSHPKVILFRLSFTDTISICGFLGNVFIVTFELQLQYKSYVGRCFGRYSIQCRGPPDIEVLHNFKVY